jgi:3-dehydroquinate synthase
METIVVQGDTGRSRIMIGENLANLKKYLPSGRTIAITDERVATLYGERFPTGERIVIGQGEGIKTLDTVAAIYEQLIRLEADRSTFIVGIGGGVVGDITGFAASTFMRGLRFGFAATTLLAQVDASVGGKNGVNFQGYKNMVGVFRQPEFVIADVELLGTLPKEEMACGLAEIVKHACIAEADYFDYIEKHVEAIAGMDREVLLRLVTDSVRIKAGVVNRDEREAGVRRVLNFGHTFGHAFEKTLKISHGAAVSLGMVMAARFSGHHHLLTDATARRVIDLLRRLALPVTAEFDRTAVIDALQKDKKRELQDIHFVLLEKLGKATIKPVTVESLRRWLDDFGFAD